MTLASLVHKKTRVHFVGIFADTCEAESHSGVGREIEGYASALCGAWPRGGGGPQTGGGLPCRRVRDKGKGGNSQTS